MRGMYPVLFPIKRGDFATVTPSAFTIGAKFYRQVGKTATCWLWMTQKHPKGYGTFKIGGITTRGRGRKSNGKGRRKLRHTMRASRLSWILHYGEIPAKMRVLHTCDTPSCVNPDHLFLGTDKDNYDDAVRKGRRIPGLNRGLGKTGKRGKTGSQ